MPLNKEQKAALETELKQAIAKAISSVAMSDLLQTNAIAQGIEAAMWWKCFYEDGRGGEPPRLPGYLEVLPPEPAKSWWTRWFDWH